MLPFMQKISIWGIASLVLLVVHFLLSTYDIYLLDHYHRPLFGSDARLQICAVVQLAAAVCGIIAVRRGGSMWWLGTALMAAFLALGCYFGEV